MVEAQEYEIQALLFGMKLIMTGSSFEVSGALRSLEAIAGKWKVRIIWHLVAGTKRFNELHRLLPGISRGTLTFELRQLQKDGIIDRTQYSTIPPTVEYKLTAREPNWPYEELGEELGSHQNRSAMLS